MSSEKVRWTIVVPKSLDLAVRQHLAERGMKKGGLSQFVVDVVRADLARWKKENERKLEADSQ